MKRVVKRFLIMVSSTVYVAMLFLAVGALEARLTFANPTTVKTWLDASGTYGAVIGEVSKNVSIEQVQEDSTIQFSESEIVNAARSSFTEQSIKTDAESAIDGLYGWLQGDTDTVEYEIDFTGRREAFATAMTTELEQKIKALPECTESGKFTAQAFDPFGADCRPKGALYATQLASFEDDLSSTDNFPLQQAYGAEDLKIDSANGQEPIYAALSWLPKAYKALLWGPWLVIFIDVLIVLALLFLSSSKRKGLKRINGGLVFTGVVLLVSGYLLGPAFTKLNAMSSNAAGSAASFNQNVIDPLITQISATYSRYNIIIGAACVIVSLMMYGALLLTRTKDGDEVHIAEAYSEQDTGLNAQPISTPAELPTEPVQVAEQEPSTPVTPVQTEPTYQPRPTLPTVPLRQAAPSQRPVTRRPPMIQG